MSKQSNVLKMLLLLQKRDLVKISELSQLLDVSPKQIRRYRDDLNDVGISIESTTGKYGGYRLLSKSEFMFTSEHILGTELKVIDLLSRVEYISIKDMYDSLMLYYMEPLNKRIRLYNLSPDIFYGLLLSHHGIANRNELSITYKYDEDVFEFNFLPYITYQKHGVWYVLGKNNLNNKVIQLQLEHVSRVSITKNTFIVPTREVEMYKNKLKKSIGVYLGDEEFEVEISSALNKNDLEELLEVKVIKQDDYYRFTSNSLTDTKRILLSIGALVKVNKPKILIQMIKNDLSMLNDIYE